VEVHKYNMLRLENLAGGFYFRKSRG